MDIGEEGKPFVIEPIEDPVPGRTPAPAPQEPPAPKPERAPAKPKREKVPA